MGQHMNFKSVLSYVHLNFFFLLHFSDHKLGVVVEGLTESLRALLGLRQLPGEWMKVGLLGGDEEDEEEDEWQEEDEALSWSHLSPSALAKWSSTDTLMEAALW